MPFKPKNTKFYHYDFQIRGRRFHGSCGTEDYEEAKAIEAEARVKAKSSQQTHGIYTLSEALGTYWTDICSHQSSAETARSQGAKILEILDPKTQINTLKNNEIMRFVQLRRADVSNATVNRQLQFLGRALRHMAKFYDAQIPALDLKAAETKEPQERIRELTMAEQSQLFAELRTDLQPLVKFALMTGARQATITGLRWTDIDLDRNRILFRLKGGKLINFPMNGEIRALLSALPKSNTIAHRSYVFTYLSADEVERRPIPKNSHLWEDFRQATTDAGIENFRFHDLRHTFATRMLRTTGNLKLVSRLLGHSSIETTTRYAHVLDDDMANAMDEFSIFSSGQSRSRPRRSENF
jgi:integrase